MTREEREDAINCFKNKLENEVFGAKYNKLALEALEQESCDDCISRKSVITIIQNHWWNCRDIDKLVNELPSVTPIRPKGHWIETAEEYYKAVNEKGGGVNENTDFFTDDIACSECLAKFSIIDNEAERFDYCPCCGSYNKQE